MPAEHLWSAILFGVTAALLLTAEFGRDIALRRAAVLLALLTVLGADVLLLSNVPQFAGLWTPVGKMVAAKKDGDRGETVDDDAEDGGSGAKVRGRTARNGDPEDDDEAAAGGAMPNRGRTTHRKQPSGSPDVVTEVAEAISAWTRPRPTLPTSKHLPGQIVKDCPDCPELVVIPPGSARNAASIAPMAPASAHKVQVLVWPGYAIGRVEITRAQFDRFATETGRGARSCAATSFDSLIATPSVQQESAATADAAGCLAFEDAVAYANWLSGRSGHRYRLATATEWLYAADLAPGLGDGPYFMGSESGAAGVAEIVSDCWRDRAGVLAVVARDTNVCVSHTVVDIPAAANQVAGSVLPRFPLPDGARSPAVGLRVVRELE